jgi:hypothetical protein
MIISLGKILQEKYCSEFSYILKATLNRVSGANSSHFSPVVIQVDN